MTRASYAPTLIFFIIAALVVGFIPLSESFLAAKNISSATWLGLPPLLLATLPPLIGITLAIVTRRLVTSLAIGVAFAALFAGGPSPLAILEKLFVDYFIKVLFSPFHIALLVFTIALIGMVGVATRSGGTQGIVNIVLRVAKGVRGARVATVLMGFIVFFDGYANTAIVGPTVQPLFDKLKISRAKLAYIIDSTAAPIAGLAIVSTWIGTEVGYLQEAAHSVGVMQSGYALFFSAMPFRFYCIFTLLVVILIAWSGRDFGPMVDAERDAQCNIPRPTSPPGEPPNPDFISLDTAHPNPQARFALVPIGLVLFLMMASVYWLGVPADTSAWGIFSPFVWKEAFIKASVVLGGNALTYAFATAAVIGAIVAIFFSASQKALPLKTGVTAFAESAKSVSVALAILIAAWGLAAAASDLNTASYVAAAMHGRIPAEAFPFIVFAVSAAVAFATGSAWGTMAILIPTMAPAAFHAGGEGIMIISMAAVLDGAVFGDHVSPISDTTILASLCSGCDHIEHVRTQTPYALLSFLIASAAGYGLVGALGAPLWVGYGSGLTLAIGFIYMPLLSNSGFAKKKI